MDECRRFEGKVGYKGQRYEVIGITHDGDEESVGWTDDPDGGGLADAVKLWPRYKSSKVIDTTEACKGLDLGGARDT